MRSHSLLWVSPLCELLVLNRWNDAKLQKPSMRIWWNADITLTSLNMKLWIVGETTNFWLSKHLNAHIQVSKTRICKNILDCVNISSRNVRFHFTFKNSFVQSDSINSVYKLIVPTRQKIYKYAVYVLSSHWESWK